MQQNLPRLILAGTNSGCGKTTVTCAVLQALVNRGLSVAAAKCGPDYIDPMFHSRIIGAKSSNLDPFFFDENTLRFLLAQNASGCDVTVIEGVMGYYDGLGLTSTRASTYELAQKTVSPVVLVVNARGAALSVLASVRGFLDFLPDDRICGVILNGCTAMTYAPLARVLEDRLGVKACGFLPGRCFDAGKLARFGYVTLTAERDNLLCRAGGSIPAHEFHHWDAEQTGDAFTAAKPSGRSWPCVFATDTLYAGYPHFHFYANPSFAVRFLDACRKGKHHAGTDQTDGH